MNADFISFVVVIIKENCAPWWSLITREEVLKTYFPCFYHQGLYRLYMNSSTWNYIFIILATFLDPKKSFRNYVEAGTNGQNVPNQVIGLKKAWLRSNISTMTVIMALIFGLHISNEVFYRPVKGFPPILNFG